MPKRLNLRSKLLLIALLTAALLQGTVPLTNERVRRVGDLLQCKCGCYASITGCNMINCHFSDPVRIKLLAMVEKGMGDEEILDEMVKIYGKEILMKPPAEGFYLLSWIMPYVGLASGLGLLFFILRRYLNRRPATAGGPDSNVEESPELAKYRDRIDKDLSDLD